MNAMIPAAPDANCDVTSGSSVRCPIAPSDFAKWKRVACSVGTAALASMRARSTQPRMTSYCSAFGAFASSSMRLRQSFSAFAFARPSGDCSASTFATCSWVTRPAFSNLALRSSTSRSPDRLGRAPALGLLGVEAAQHLPAVDARVVRVGELEVHGVAPDELRVEDRDDLV